MSDNLFNKIVHYIETNTNNNNYKYSRNDFILKDNGDGKVFIEKWNLGNIEKPDMEQLKEQELPKDFKKEITIEERIKKIEEILKKNKIE